MDDEGKLLLLEEYSPYGATTFRATDKKIVQRTPSYRFSNYLRDTKETGLYFCQTRYLALWLGRWISPDPLGTADGLNMYRRVSNDPINFQNSCGTMKQPRTSGGGGYDQRPGPSRPSNVQQGLQLGIERHVLNFNGGRAHIWSSIVEFDGPMTSEHLVRASRLAYNEMEADFANSGGHRALGGGMPGVMTAYVLSAMPNMVIFSSSAKKAGLGDGARGTT